MKILQFEYQDKSLGWHLKPVDFSKQNLSLLVGVSGVGKTLILQAIINIKNIAKGKSFNGVKWDILFSAQNTLQYHWEGEFQFYQNIENSEKEFEIIFEKLTVNGKLLAERKDTAIHYDGILITPKLSPFQSIPELFRQEEKVRIAYEELSKIKSDAQAFGNPVVIPWDQLDSLKKQYADLENIRKSDLLLWVKLILLYSNLPEQFKHISDHFKDIFPQVEEIKIGIQGDFSMLNTRMTELPILMKERHVNTWIHQKHISAGMLKTLHHLCEMYLLPEGSVILTDEFENSLGVNCIDSLTDILFQEKRDLQFVITSHHPYIINNISKKYWKIVTRKGSEVNVRDADEFPLGKTKHSAFIELMQLEAYTEAFDGMTADTIL